MNSRFSAFWLTGASGYDAMVFGCAAGRQTRADTPATPVNPKGGMERLEVQRVGNVQQIVLGDDPVTIGRARDNDLVLTDRMVSRHHCVIERDGDAVRLRDLKSTYGTTVNGRTVDEATLSAGDRIGIGPFLVAFFGDGSSDPAVLPIENGEADSSEPIMSGRKQHTLNRRRDELEQRSAALDQRAAELDARAEQLARQEASIGGESGSDVVPTDKVRRLQESLADAEAELEKLRAQAEPPSEDADSSGRKKRSRKQTVAKGDSSDDAQRQQIAAERAELEELRKSLEQKQKIVRDLRRREEEVAAREQNAEQLERELERRRIALDEKATAPKPEPAQEAEPESRPDVDARFQELQQREESLEVRAGQLEAAQQQAAQVREQVESLREDIERRAEEVDDREKEMAVQQDEVRRLWEQLDAERREIQQQAEQDQARRDVLEQQVQEQKQQLDAAMAEAARKDEAMAADAESFGRMRAELEEQINRVETELFELREQQETGESDKESLRQQVNRATAELDQRMTQLDDSQRHVGALQERIEELERSHSLASQLNEQIDSALRNLHEPAELMRIASTRLAAAQKAVADLEQQWVKCDARFNQLDTSNPAEAQKALNERDRIAARLEQAHAAQDAASAELRAAVEEVVRRIRAIPATQMESAATTASEGSVPQRSSRRRWFSRKG